MSELDTIDETVFHELSSALGATEMAEGLELLATQMETYLSTMTQLIETEDSAALTNVAHSLQGATATFGLQAIAALAKSLEEIAARSDFSGCRALTTLLRSAIQRDLNKARGLIAQTS